MDIVLVNLLKNLNQCKCYNKTDRKIQSKIDKILSVFYMQFL